MDSLLSFFSVTSVDELLTPSSLLALVVGVVVLYFFLPRKEPERPEEDEPKYTPVEKRDMTVSELLEYNGSDPSKAILLAVCGKIYDVTKGKDFYGPGGPYAALAGYNATRALGTMDASHNAVKDTDDDCSDLSPGELSQAQEWGQTFAYKYDIIGNLLKASDAEKEEEPAEKEEEPAENEEEPAENEEEPAEKEEEPAEKEEEPAEKEEEPAERNDPVFETGQVAAEENVEKPVEPAQPVDEADEA